MKTTRHGKILNQEKLEKFVEELKVLRAGESTMFKTNDIGELRIAVSYVAQYITGPFDERRYDYRVDETELNCKIRRAK